MGVLREGRPARDEQARDRVADQGRRAGFAGHARATRWPPWTRRWSARRRRSATRAQGQSGLFGLFDETPARGRNADDLPQAADWEESVRLANEKEVLGFFVSGHPLDKYAEKLRNLTGVISVAEALERKPPERRWGGQQDTADEIQVAGIIHGLRVQKSRRDQRLYAQASLEDATGKIELICFARDYETAVGAVEDGSAGAGARDADGR